MSAPTPFRRAVMVWLLKLAVSAGLVWLLVHRSDFDTITSTMGRIPPTIVFALVLLYLVGMLLSAVKWRLLIPAHPAVQLLALNFVAQFYAIALAGQLAGEVVKALKLARGRDDAELIAASIVVDKLTGLLAVLLVGVIGMKIGSNAVPPIITWPLAGMLLCGLAALFSLRSRRVYGIFDNVLGWIAGTTPRLTGAAARLRFFLDAWRRFSARPQILGLSLAFGCAMQLVHVGAILLIAREIGISLSPGDWMWVFAVVSVATILPLSLGGIGIREGAFVGVLGFLGIPSALALALSFTILGLQLFGASVGAVLDFATWGTKAASTDGSQR